jgi:hypothetical protein
MMHERIDLSTVPSAMETLAQSWRKPAQRIPHRAEPAPSHSGRCSVCDAKLGRTNKSGLCRKHVASANARDPKWREKQRAGIRRKIENDPAYRGELRVRARKAAASRDPDVMRERWLRDRVWEKSNPSNPAGSDARRRAGRSISARRLADIPAHLRDDYRHLVKVKRFSAAEAREMIAQLQVAEAERGRPGATR